jgi:hypothetical protein
VEVVAFFQRLSLSPLLPPWLPWSVPAGAASFGLGRKSQRDELMAEGGGCWMCSAGCCGCATRSRGVLVVRECVWKVEDSGAFKKEKLPSIKSKRTPATDRQPLFKKIHRHPLVCTRRNTRQPATPSHPTHPPTHTHAHATQHGRHDPGFVRRHQQRLLPQGEAELQGRRRDPSRRCQHARRVPPLRPE